MKITVKVGDPRGPHTEVDCPSENDAVALLWAYAKDIRPAYAWFVQGTEAFSNTHMQDRIVPDTMELKVRQWIVSLNMVSEDHFDLWKANESRYPVRNADI